ncbi:MAG: hypothetical protein A2498_06385 [Lentisphaerae bacterium RIFOXYC12_FULL_60_16]|nr:MAG: hypothetical protein A2498_06385 [Lentisphaerae bacterium RIFOXYC12_FULL_60_16]
MKDSSVREYLAQIGRKGGMKSRRRLSTEDAKNMVRLRDAKRAFNMFYSQCFWYMREHMDITLADVPEIVRGLRQNGGRQGFLLAARLCR